MFFKPYFKKYASDKNIEKYHYNLQIWSVTQKMSNVTDIYFFHRN